MIFRILGYIIALIMVIDVLFPFKFPGSYDFIPNNDILHELAYVTKVKHNYNLGNCVYNYYPKENIDINELLSFKHYEVALGGEYRPNHCNPKFSTAIIVPYRDRKDQLNFFLNFFHRFLQKQFIHYRIFIVEQEEEKLFNRAKLFNIGAVEAMKLNFPCLILHDIDLIPFNEKNLYVCTKNPRHMSTNVDTFRFILPYRGLFGGAVAILSEQFKHVNGMSNMFFGWGGEDDDFYSRLVSKKLTPVRFSPEICKYTMLKHKKQKKSETRYEMLNTGEERFETDGLNSLSTNYTISLKKLYTHIHVHCIT